MLAAVFFLLAGFGVSIWGLLAKSNGIIIAGFATMVVVCASWWFWVMFVIRSMIKYTERTTVNIGDIKIGIYELRRLIHDYESARNR
jgi:hypothetical protein